MVNHPHQHKEYSTEMVTQPTVISISMIEAAYARIQTAQEASEPTIISPAMIEAAYARIQADQEEQELDTRNHPTSQIRFLAAQRGGFEAPAQPWTITMIDEIVHTVDFPFCGDESCPCYYHREPRPQKKRRSHNLFTIAYGQDLPLNGNRPFRIL